MFLSNRTPPSTQVLTEVTQVNQSGINILLHVLIATPVAILTLYHPLSYVLLAIMSLAGMGLYIRTKGWNGIKGKDFMLHPVMLVLFFVGTIYLTAITQDAWEVLDRRKLEDMTWALLLLGIIPIHQRWGSRNTFWWGVIGCAVLSGFVALYEVNQHGLNVRAAGMKGKPIMFGDVAMMASVFSVIAVIHFQKRGMLWLSMLAFIAAALGLFGSIQSGTRGAWLFAPVFGVLLIIYLVKAKQFKIWLPVLFIIPLVIFALLEMTPNVSSRVHMAIEQVQNYLQQQPKSESTSIGQRFEMWRIGLEIFSEHPLTGVGLGQLNNYYEHSVERGEGTFLAIRHHAHNEYLNTLISRGLIGITGLIALLLGSAYFFYRRLDQNPTIALSGVSLIAGYATFGLTDSILFFKFSLVFFFSCLYLLVSELSREQVTE